MLYYDEPSSCGDVIESRQVHPPDTSDLTKWIFHYNMRKLIVNLSQTVLEEMTTLAQEVAWEHRWINVLWNVNVEFLSGKLAMLLKRCWGYST